ncbi:MAG TPA: copper resistance CopC family protein [Stellaceae bacterium]|jgi:copper resistance protein C|nr:copper resistance CopC family protein [Stellaceae bacterium]
MSLAALRGLVAVLLLAGTALEPLPASAHAIVVSASPADGAVLASGDAPVLLRFNSRIDHQRSRLSLIAADGSTTVLPVDPAASTDSLVARLVGLPPGQYRLRWQVLALDGHITRGDIPFTVKP